MPATGVYLLDQGRRAIATGEGLATALEFRHDPLRFVRKLAGRGSFVPLRVLVWDVLFVNDPGGLRHVLQDNHRNYGKDAPLYKIAASLLGQGLITSDGPVWRRQRVRVRSIFKRDHIASLTPVIVEATRQMLDRWEREVEGRRSFDVADEIEDLTRTIISRAMFGTDLDRSSAFGRAFIEGNRILADFTRLPFPPLDWPLPRGHRLRRALGVMDASVLESIGDYRSGAAGRTDTWLAMLVAADDERSPEADRRLRDEVMTLLLSGIETSANALAWTVFLLGRHDDVDARVHEEARAVLEEEPGYDALARLPVTRSVIEEAMRLYPPAWFLMRRAVGEDTLGGHRVAPGTLIFFSPYALHRHPRLWPDPERFDPERFAADRRDAIDRFSYIPFSVGPRACIGSGLAMLETQIVLAMIAERYRLVLDTLEPPRPQPMFTLRPPRDGIWVRPVRR